MAVLYTKYSKLFFLIVNLILLIIIKIFDLLSKSSQEQKQLVKKQYNDNSYKHYITSYVIKPACFKSYQKSQIIKEIGMKKYLFFSDP